MDYFNKLIYTGSYAGQYEFIKASNLWKINICVYNMEITSKDNKTFKYKFETIISDQENYNEYNPFIPTLLIGWVNSNHYELLIPIDTYIDIPIEYQLKTNEQNSKKLQEKVPSEEIKELSNNDNDDTSKIEEKNDELIKLSDKYKYELTHFVENELEDIFNYLNSNINNKNNKEKCWPEYIINASKHNKNLLKRDKSSGSSYKNKNNNNNKI